MFKLILGALIASVLSIFLTSRVQRLYFAGVIFLAFVIIEIIFIAGGGD
jgi:hypothetical protein